MRGVAHSPSFKARMIQKMLSPGGPSAYALAAEANVSQSTRSRWKRDALTLGDMGDKKKTRNGKTSRQRWSVEERLRLVHEAIQLSDEELDAFLRASPSALGTTGGSARS